jgi:hypothetical protein
MLRTNTCASIMDGWRNRRSKRSNRATETPAHRSPPQPRLRCQPFVTVTSDHARSGLDVLVAAALPAIPGPPTKLAPCAPPAPARLPVLRRAHDRRTRVAGVHAHTVIHKSLWTICGTARAIGNQWGPEREVIFRQGARPQARRYDVGAWWKQGRTGSHPARPPRLCHDDPVPPGRQPAPQ